MTENKRDMTATEARPAPAGADAPAAPARNPEQTSPGKTLDAILADAASRPAEFVESWEVPGGAE